MSLTGILALLYATRTSGNKIFMQHGATRIMKKPHRKPVKQTPLFTLTFAWLSLFFASSVFASSQPYITDHQINFGTGNKYLQATDIRLPDPGPQISLTRTYNSQSNDVSVLGHGWTAPHTERLIIDTDEIILVQKGGRYVHFPEESPGVWVNETGARRVITASGTGYLLTEQSGITKLYNSGGKISVYTDRNNNTRTYSYDGSGQLTLISNNFGGTISFTHTNGRLVSATGPEGTYSYGYDANSNLTTITKPDTTIITYIYDDPNDVHNLTGVLNEESERILTVAYDSSDRVIRSIKQGGANEVTIGYPSNTVRTVANSVGVTTTYNLDVLRGVVMVGSFTGPGCSSCGSTSDMSYLYDDRLQITQKTDALGTITGYTYDGNGNKLSMTEGVGSALEKTTTYTYTADNRVETITTNSIANPGNQQVTTMSYDTAGNLLTRTESGFQGTTPISRTTTYTYNSYGQVTSIDGPRIDVSDTITITYYPNEAAQGNNRSMLHTVSNSLGHVTTYADYNVHGQAETITAANGLVTTRTYTSKGLLSSSTTAGLTTSYVYNTAGELQSITQPGGRTITYGYDSGGRVNRITDNEGNYITYSYDSEGRKTGEEIHDPAGSLVRFAGFEYNDNGYLSKETLPGNAERTYAYDAVGNLVQSINATGLQSDMAYDLFSRLESLTEDSSVTNYFYDAEGNITSVIDARGNATSFSYDDFGRRTSRVSPETGTTLYSYDAAGNLESITDALNHIVGFSYDALDRPITQTYGSTTINFSYDQDTNSTGQISSVTDEYGSRSFLYNTLGQLTNETREIGGVSYNTGYSYTATTAEMESITYPSGMVVQYSRATDGQVTAFTIDGATVIDAITHLPFGPLKTATLGSTMLTKGYDQRYNLSSIQAGTLNRSYTLDAEGHVTGIDNLTSPTPAALSEDYIYDLASNKLNSRGTTSYTYDAVGKILSDGIFTFTYDELNRITQVESGGSVIATYGYDSSNRRIIKTVGITTTHYLYDASSNLIAETMADGTVNREYIYLDGEIFVVNEYQNNPGLYYYLNDHLGTPQQLVSATGTVVWQAAYLPFGKAQIGVADVVNNVRFPGQYFDAETGLHYNWHRFYDPSTGRYINADPIGLAGGINLYAYVENDPVNAVDPWGLITCVNNNNQLCKLTCQIHYEGDPDKEFWFDEHDKAKPPLGYCANTDSPHFCEAIPLGHYFNAERKAKKKRDKCLEECDKLCKEPECEPSN